MAAKQVDILSAKRHFNTQTEAINHYRPLPKELKESNKLVIKGEALFEELKEIYSRYCQNTCYETDRLNSITGFKGVDTTREVNTSSGYITTTCLAVVFEDGSEKEFSIEKAIKAIATQ